MAPLGIILGGLAASQFETSQTLRAEAVFDALAAGTFIYIATIDNMPQAFCCKKDRWMNFGALCFGVRLDGHAVVCRIGSLASLLPRSQKAEGGYARRQ